MCTALRASRLAQDLSRSDILDFLKVMAKEFDGQRKLPVPLYPIDAIAFCIFNCTIRYFVQRYTCYSLPMLAKSCKTERNLMDSEPQSGSEQYVALSATEKGRLERAFCLFETYRHLFAGLSIFSAREQADLFLKIFPKPLIEELACVRNFLKDHLCDTFGRVEDRFVETASRDGSDLDAEEEPTGRWENDDSWFSRLGKKCHSGDMEHLMSLGLPFLHQMFEADDAKCLDLISSNIKTYYDKQTFLGKSLAEPEESVANSQEIQDDYDGWEYEFDDDTSKVTEGWLWATSYKTVAIRADRERKGLRYLGYVFWDSSRLRASGILKAESVGFTATYIVSNLLTRTWPSDVAEAMGLAQTRKNTKPSAQERLLGPRRK